jgi:PPP family 3-phenylpropionic acid transporter
MAPIRRAALTYVVYFAAVGAAWPYLPIYYRQLGLDLATIGLLAALSAATQLVAAPIWGGLTDRYPRTRLTLPAAALVGAAGALVLARADGLPTVVFGALVVSFGLAGIGPVLDARVLDLLGSDRHRYGQLRAWGSLSFVVVTLFVGIALDGPGVAALFIAYVPLLVLTAVVSATLPRGRSTAGGSVLRGAWAFVVAPGMRLFLFASLLVWGLLAAVTAFYSIQVAALGGAPALVGFVWAFGAIVEVPIMFGFPRLADRFGAERLMVAGAAAFAVRAAIAAVARDPVLLVLAAPLEGTGFALSFVGGVGYVGRRARPGLAATAQGVYSGTSGLAAIVGNALGGFLADALTIPGMFAACAALGVAATVVLAVAVLGRRDVADEEGAGRTSAIEGRTG